VPAERLALHRPAGVLPAGDLPGGVDVLWVLSAAGAAAAAGWRAGALQAGLGLALVLALRLAPRGIAPAAVAALGARLAGAAGLVGHVVRALAAAGLVVALELLGAGALWWAAALVLVAELLRPASGAARLSGGARGVAAALPPVALALLLGALGRAVDAVTGVLAAPEPALLVVAGAGAALALGARRGTGHGAARDVPATSSGGGRWADRGRGLRRVVATPRGAARCAALTPVLVAAALAPLHVLGLGAGASGAALLLLALGGGALAGCAGASRWEAAAGAPGSVLSLSAGAAPALVLLAGPVTDLVLAAVLLALAGAAAGVAVVASDHLDGAGPAAAPVGRGVEGAVLGVVVVLAALAAGVLGAVSFPLGSAGRLDVGGAGVVLVLVGLAGLLASLVVARPLADRTPGPLLPVLLGHGAGAPAARAGGGAGRERRGGAHGLAGVLVALEGGDGAGKSTQAATLGRELSRRGLEVVVTREPGATPLGARVRGLLLDRGEDQPAVPPRAEALLYAADRAAHVAQVVRPALARGAVVVTDRYVDSSLAYQGAGRALPPEEVASLSRWATEGLVPDLVVVLDVDAATAAARRAGRGADDRLDAEPAAFHERVRQVFLDLARRGGDRYLVVDAGAAPEEVARRVLAGLEPLLPARGDDGAREESELREAGPVRAGASAAAVVVPGSPREPAAPPATQPIDLLPSPGADVVPEPALPPTAPVAEERERREAEERERREAEERERREAEERERREAEERERREAEERERREAEERERREAEERERREAEERERREAEERERREAELRRVQAEVARERAATSFRSAEMAVEAARALGDARRPVVEVPAAPAGGRRAAAPALPARLPEERLRQLPDAVRRSAVDVADAQREARETALSAAAQERARLQRERRRAQEQQRLAELAARERAEAERAHAVAREQEERRARQEAEEARAEEARRAGSRRRAETERLEEMLGRGGGPSSPGAHPAPRTAELPAVGEGRPALHELEAADRRRQALQRARRRAAASRRRAESGQADGTEATETTGATGATEEPRRGGGALADELFSWQDDDGRPGGRG